MSSAELPPCDGPKIQAFKHRFSPIYWAECIGGIGENGEDIGSQAYVFKVEIQLKTYALKVFKFFNPSTQSFVLGPILGRQLDADELAFHTDPFFAECRAYGRIEEARAKEKRARQVAAQCYGFLILGASEVERLKKNGFDLWPEDLPPGHEYRTMADGSPVRALVKEYIEDDQDPDLRAMSWMLKDIRFLNRNGCLNRDIKRDNYRNGLLVDFGCAWTEPHCLIRLAGKERVENWKKADRVQFDTMARELGFGDAIHAIPNWEYRQKLRESRHDSLDDETQSEESSSIPSTASRILVYTC
ncbi:kinetochore Sim4 complex subunit FTA2-domain-containing protein [Diaporthe sp. PMI_573]|nr:kinetochore Sim4 complex subunit FTA2-domain-containing protein [Diaporthaceae sp. PMI_573]